MPIETDIPSSLRTPGSFHTFKKTGARGLVPTTRRALLIGAKNDDTPGDAEVVRQLFTEVDAEALVVEDDGDAEELTEIMAKHDLPAEERVILEGSGDALAFDPDVNFVTLTSDDLPELSAEFIGNYEIEISGATTPANDGTFRIEDTSGGTAVVWSNASGVTESFGGTWKIRRIKPPLVQTLTEIEEE